MESKDARAALDAVHEVSTSAELRSGGSTPPLSLAVVTCVCAGGSMGLMKLGNTWVALALLLALVILTWITYATSRKNGVRRAVKQDVKGEPPMSWRMAVPLLVLPFTQLLPDRSVPWALFTGVGVTILFAATMRWEFNSNAA